MLSYEELIKNRRSIRDYEDKNVSMEIIQDLLKETCQAPSSCNKQPWRFIVINNKEVMKKLSDESKKNMVQDIESDPNSKYKRFEKRLRDPEYNVFYNAPCLIIIAGQNDYPWFLEDITLAASYFMFAAVAKELGTCWTALGAQIRDPDIKRKIGLPDDYEIVAPIILGYPKNTPETSEREEPIVLKTIK